MDADARIAELEAELELSRRLLADAQQQARRRAMDLNDNVMQSLVLAGYRLATGPDDARRSLEQAIAQCQRIVHELLDATGESPGPGSLRRQAAGSVF